MAQINRNNSYCPGRNHWSIAAVWVHNFGLLCFLLLLMTVVGSGQSKRTPINCQTLPKAELTADSKKKADPSSISTGVVVTDSARSGCITEADLSPALSPTSRNAELNTFDAPPSNKEVAASSLEESSSRVTLPDLAGDGEERLKLRPEVFIQGRYSFWPIRYDGSESASRFSLTQLEVGWSGRLAHRFGLGLELQLHSITNGEPRDVINDIFVEYYLNDNFNLRAGQFTKPFGFDVQYSSALRESPERAMFAGYFFPGEQDRSGQTCSSWCHLFPWRFQREPLLL